MAVLITWNFTAIGSQMFTIDMSVIFLALPSIPKVELPLSACLALSSVMILTTSIPQFVARVLGMTSKA